MKTPFTCTLLAVGLISSLCADVFHLGRMQAPDGQGFIINPKAVEAFKSELGKDPSYPVTPNWEGAETAYIVFGRLLGVTEGEGVGVSGYGFTNDILNVQVLTRDGELVGKPIHIPVTLLNPFTRRSEIDTHWDLERFYGNIAETFVTEMGEDMFEMALGGILDPTGEMGLNTLQVAVDLPEEFTHGWLTHFVYFGKSQDARQNDAFALDAANAFDAIFIGEGAAHSLQHHHFYWGGAGAMLIDQLTRDSKYNTFEPGVREHVLGLIGHLLDFSQVDPANVQDPTLRERAKRILFLGAQTQAMLFNTMSPSSNVPQEEPLGGERAFTQQERAHVVFDVIEANRARFDRHHAQVMRLLLNAGMPEQRKSSNRPHPDCADRAYALYFDLLTTGPLAGDEAYNERIVKAAKLRRSVAAPALISGVMNDDSAFTARTRAAFNRIGYGSTEEVQAIVDALDVVIPTKYMGELIFDKKIGLAMPDFEFNEIAAPSGFGDFGRPSIQQEETQSFSVSFHGCELSDEVLLDEALTVLKDIAFNLPEGTIGRSTKMRIVENWRQIQLQELEASLERQFRAPDDPPAELSSEQKIFKQLLTDDWKPNDGGGVEL